MRTHFLSKAFSAFLLLVLFVSTTVLVSCSDDPEPVNEEEVITTVRITLTRDGGIPMTLEWDDTNLDGVVDESEITQNVRLTENTVYAASITLLNKSVNPEQNVTEEIEEEAEDHLFCFSSTAGITMVATDEDANGLPIGLLSTWTTGANESTGNVRVILKHQHETKNGECDNGETDIDLTFPIGVAVRPS